MGLRKGTPSLPAFNILKWNLLACSLIKGNGRHVGFRVDAPQGQNLAQPLLVV
jgi:hypothetical protein